MKPTRISLETFASDPETYLDGVENNELVLTKEGEPRFVLLSTKRAAALYETVLSLMAHSAMEDAGGGDDGDKPEENIKPDGIKSE